MRETYTLFKTNEKKKRGKKKKRNALAPSGPNESIH